MLASPGSARSATSVTPLENVASRQTTDDRRSGRARAIFGMLFVVVAVSHFVAFSIWQMQTTGDVDMLSGNRFVRDTFTAIAGAGLCFWDSCLPSSGCRYS